MRHAAAAAPHQVAAADPDCRYALGSVLNHVLLHQTIIGEARPGMLLRASIKGSCGYCAARVYQHERSHTHKPCAMPVLSHLQEALKQLAKIGEKPDVLVRAQCTHGVRLQ